jgi:signal transduction histidine kinase
MQPYLFFIVIVLGIGFICMLLHIVSLYHHKQTWLRATEWSQLLVKEKEHTLTHIGCVLHDQVVQLVSLSEGMLHNALRSQSVLSVPQIIQLHQRMRQEIKSITLSCHSLSLTQIGLIGYLHTVADQYMQAYGIQVCVQDTQWYTPPSGEEQLLMLIRIVQEVLYNSYRHSHADCITLRFIDAPTYWGIIICDNGVEKKHNSSHTGIGVQLLAARVKLLNGTYEYLYYPTTCFKLQIPK